jgi:hypothetical protein
MIIRVIRVVKIIRVIRVIRAVLDLGREAGKARTN